MADGSGRPRYENLKPVFPPASIWVFNFSNFFTVLLWDEDPGREIEHFLAFRFVWILFGSRPTIIFSWPLAMYSSTLIQDITNFTLL